MKPKFRILIYRLHVGLGNTGNTMFLHGEGSYEVVTQNEAAFFLGYTMLHSLDL